MAFDGITTKLIVSEISKLIIDSRIEKIYEPNKNEIILSLHTQDRKNYKLLISIDANNSRLHLTEKTRDNPAIAPQFCMILRKYLQGGRITNIVQTNLDRIIAITVENIDDFGDYASKNLIIELMGKYSNVILTSETKIVDSIRHVTSSMSSVREVLPGKEYISPSSMGKLNFLEVNWGTFSSSLNQEAEIASAISDSYTGFSKSFCASICNELNIDMNTKVSDLNKEDLNKIYLYLVKIIDDINNQKISLKLSENQKDYYPISCDNQSLNSFFLENFYDSKEALSLLKNAKLNLEHEINSQLNKLKKKLAIAEETLSDEPNLEKYKKYGELISANIYKMQIGMDKLVTEDFYNNNELIEIPLATNQTPSQNAQSYFKKYAKLKNSIAHAIENKTSYEKDISYLESVLFNISEAQNMSELEDIKEELASADVIKKPGKRYKRKDLPSEPIRYEKNGIEILVGRNNFQNDKLTFKVAKKNEMWLHVKDFHGSHVIVRSDNIPDEVLLYAASLAVLHSQAKGNQKVQVDYTLVKYVHKENGSKPGMVVYTDYNSIIV